MKIALLFDFKGLGKIEPPRRFAPPLLIQGGEKDQQRIPQSWRGIKKTCVAVLISWLGIASFSPTAYSGIPAPQLNAWLSESRLPPAVQNAFRARFATDPQAREWLVTEDRQVYAIVYQSFSPATHAQIQQAIRSTAEMKARNLLLLYAAGEHYQQQGFGNREAIAKALTTLETTTQGQLLPGLQSRATVLDQSAVALVWIEEDRIANYRQQLPPLTQFRPAYCQALYPTAKALFHENRYQKALTIYQEMHHLQCRQPTAYFLDAAECFIALHQTEDAKRMANYLFREYAPTLSSSELERAGDVLFKTGDEENAGAAYKVALSKLREGD